MGGTKNSNSMYLIHPTLRGCWYTIIIAVGFTHGYWN